MLRVLHHVIVVLSLELLGKLVLLEDLVDVVLLVVLFVVLLVVVVSRVTLFRARDVLVELVVVASPLVPAVLVEQVALRVVERSVRHVVEPHVVVIAAVSRLSILGRSFSWPPFLLAPRSLAFPPIFMLGIRVLVFGFVLGFGLVFGFVTLKELRNTLIAEIDFRQNQLTFCSSGLPDFLEPSVC